MFLTLCPAPAGQLAAKFIMGMSTTTITNSMGTATSLAPRIFGMDKSVAVPV